MTDLKNFLSGISQKLHGPTKGASPTNSEITALLAQARELLNRGALNEVDELFEQALTAPSLSARALRIDLALKFGELHLYSGWDLSRSSSEDSISGAFNQIPGVVVHFEKAANYFKMALNWIEKSAMSATRAKLHAYLGDALLGVAIFQQGTIESDPAKYEETVYHLKTSLAHIDPSIFPDIWLRIAEGLWNMHQAASSTFRPPKEKLAFLKEAEATIEEALEKMNFQKGSPEEGNVLRHLAIVRLQIARIKDDKGAIEGAIRLLRYCYDLIGHDLSHMERARTLFFAGDGLINLGILTSSASLLRESDEIFSSMLKDPEMRVDSAMRGEVLLNRGRLLTCLGEWSDDVDLLREAETAYESVKSSFSKDRDFTRWARAVLGLKNTSILICYLTQRVTDFRAATLHLEQVLEVCETLGEPLEKAKILRALGDLRSSIGASTKNSGELKKSISAYHEAIDICRVRNEAALLGVLSDNLKTAEGHMSQLSAETNTPLPL
jgi:tetratricopeptide (TPR) repeat protein